MFVKCYNRQDQTEADMIITLMLSGQEIDHFSEKESVDSKGTESIAK